MNSENNNGGLYRPRTTRYEPTPQDIDLVEKWAGAAADAPAAASQPTTTEGHRNGEQRHTFPTQQSAPQQSAPQQSAPQQSAPQFPRAAAAPEPDWNVQPDAMDYRGADDLNSSSLLKPRHAAPRRGWRRFLFKATAGSVNPGQSAHEREMHRRREALAAPLDNCFRVTVYARKGGVGKTTSSIGVGMALANARRDHVGVLDGNPDAGSAGDRIPKQTDRTVRDFRADLDSLRTYQEMRRYTNQDPVTGLEVLASSQDPAESKAFGRGDYIETVKRLSDEYQILITDSGTDITADVQDGVRELSHAYVLACGTRVDEAKKAAATFDWMQNHGHHDKVASSIVLIVSNSPVNKTVRLDEIRRHFEQRCRAVVYIPFDDHLNEGGIIVWDELRRQTREAFEYAAEYVAEGFNRVPGINQRQG